MNGHRSSSPFYPDRPVLPRVLSSMRRVNEAGVKNSDLRSSSSSGPSRSCAAVLWCCCRRPRRPGKAATFGSRGGEIASAGALVSVPYWVRSLRPLLTAVDAVDELAGAGAGEETDLRHNYYVRRDRDLRVWGGCQLRDCELCPGPAGRPCPIEYRTAQVPHRVRAGEGPHGAIGDGELNNRPGKRRDDPGAAAVRGHEHVSVAAKRPHVSNRSRDHLFAARSSRSRRHRQCATHD